MTSDEAAEREELEYEASVINENRTDIGLHMLALELDDPRLPPAIRRAAEMMGKGEANSWRLDDTHVVLFVRVSRERLVALVMDAWAAAHLCSRLCSAVSEIGYIDRTLAPR